MKTYNDREVNRLLAAADDLLADIQLYETPEEEQKRKQQEELRQSEEPQQEEELQQLEGLQKEGELQQSEELQREEELQQQKEIRRSEGLRQQEEAEQQIELSQLVELEEEEALRRLEEIQRQEAINMQEKSRQMKRMRLREMTGRQEESQPIMSVNTREIEQAEWALLEETSGMKPSGRMWIRVLFVVVSMIYLELLTHFGLYHAMDAKVIHPILFAAGFGCIVAVIVSFLSKRWNMIIFCIILILSSLYCDLQLLYHAVTGGFLKLTELPGEIGGLTQAGDSLLAGFEEVLPFLMFMFLPILLWAFVGRGWIQFERGKWLNRLLVFLLGCILSVISVLCLDIHGYEAASPYVCAYRFDSDTLLEPTGEQLGITAMTVLEMLEQIQSNVK